MRPESPDDGGRGRLEVMRVGDLSAAERAALVRKRRWFRRVKAVAAIGLALAAGTFLACAARQARTTVPSGRPIEGEGVGGDETLDAGARDASLDAEEHRNGMPVPDNLLE